jgi:hypothetical protein
MSQPTEESFLKDVANHSIKILKDDGVYRHLQFSNNGSWNQRFDIVTWSGYLAYSGDMGCFVFSRLNDMFEFFRTDRRYKDRLGINLGYWGEKLEAVDRDGYDSNFREFSSEKFEELVNEHTKEWIADYSLTEDQTDELWEWVKEDVLRRSDNEHEAHESLRDFSCKIEGHTFEFSDTWEWDLREYTYRFIWCCYALTWGIQMYDKVKEENVQA